MSLGGRLRAALGVVQPAGWAMIAAALVALVVGMRWDWRELVLLGVAGLAVLLASIPWLPGRAQVEIGLVAEPHRVVAGHSVSASLRVTNLGGGRHRPLVLDLAVGGELSRYDIPHLPPGGGYEESFVIRTERRGVIPVGPVTVRRGDPLGLLSRDAVWADRIEVLVRPPMVALEELGTGLLRDLEGVTTDAISESDLAFHALREYVPGDDLRHVHWRSSAKLAAAGHGQLLVRQYLQTRRSHATFVVEDRAAGWGSEDEFEIGLSAVASLVGRAILDEIDATVVCGTHSSTGGAGAEALDAVCRAETGDTGLVESALLAAARVPETSLLFLVGGSRTDFETFQRAASGHETDVRTVAIRVATAEPNRVVEVAGMTILQVSRLRDLPPLLHGILA